ncbi:MAG: hypothetical protein J6V14_00035 [Clostridia bacterium]|nr:hypothetical protein [Clostridia bacterium]
MSNKADKKAERLARKQARKQKRIDPEDDGRVIASMNVDGMPWHNPVANPAAPENVEENREKLGELDKKQTLFLVLGVVGAALAVAAVFVVVYFLFILFCRYVWFK